MKLSTKGKYGVKALFELAMHQGAGPMSLKAIAERQGLSEHYLEQLAAPLRKAGLITSIRGAQGGYVLSRAPEEVSIGAIIRVLEGPMDDDEDARVHPRSLGAWERVRDRLVALVDSINLADLVEEAKAEQSQHSLSYHI